MRRYILESYTDIVVALIILRDAFFYYGKGISVHRACLLFGFFIFFALILEFYKKEYSKKSLVVMFLLNIIVFFISIGILFLSSYNIDIYRYFYSIYYSSDILADVFLNSNLIISYILSFFYGIRIILFILIFINLLNLFVLNLKKNVKN